MNTTARQKRSTQRFADRDGEDFPRIIWVFWAQGWDQAPQLVQRCIQSWITANPDWQVIVLDNTNLAEHCDIPQTEEWWRDLSRNHQSDLLRFKLLAERGGVWAAATTYCAIPLNQWLLPGLQSGFFAFANPGPDRLIASWFLAGRAGNPLLCQLADRLQRHWARNPYNVRSENAKRLIRIAGKLFNRSVKTTHWWFHPLIYRGLAIYPYYCAHYMFAEVLRNDAVCRKIWESTPKILASDAFALLRNGLSSPPSPALVRQIQEAATPVYKLSWKKPWRESDTQSAVHMLMDLGRDTIV